MASNIGSPNEIPAQQTTASSHPPRSSSESPVAAVKLCACGGAVGEEDGLSVQCRLCHCWRHLKCVVGQVKEGYTCSDCKNSPPHDAPNAKDERDEQQKDRESTANTDESTLQNAKRPLNEAVERELARFKSLYSEALKKMPHLHLHGGNNGSAKKQQSVLADTSIHNVNFTNQPILAFNGMDADSDHQAAATANKLENNKNDFSFEFRQVKAVQARKLLPIKHHKTMATAATMPHTQITSENEDEFGVFACESIDPGTCIGEYAVKSVCLASHWLESHYKTPTPTHNSHHYITNTTTPSIKKGAHNKIGQMLPLLCLECSPSNIFRLLRHSCRANCEIKAVLVNGGKRIHWCIFAKNSILHDDELCLPLQIGGPIKYSCSCPLPPSHCLGDLWVGKHPASRSTNTVSLTSSPTKHNSGNGSSQRHRNTSSSYYADNSGSATIIPSPPDRKLSREERKLKQYIEVIERMEKSNRKSSSRKTSTTTSPPPTHTAKRVKKGLATIPTSSSFSSSSTALSVHSSSSTLLIDVVAGVQAEETKAKKNGGAPIDSADADGDKDPNDDNKKKSKRGRPKKKNKPSADNDDQNNVHLKLPLKKTASKLYNHAKEDGDGGLKKRAEAPKDDLTIANNILPRNKDSDVDKERVEVAGRSQAELPQKRLSLTDYLQKRKSSPFEQPSQQASKLKPNHDSTAVSKEKEDGHINVEEEEEVLIDVVEDEAHDGGSDRPISSGYNSTRTPSPPSTHSTLNIDADDENDYDTSRDTLHAAALSEDGGGGDESLEEGECQQQKQQQQALAPHYPTNARDNNNTAAHHKPAKHHHYNSSRDYNNYYGDDYGGKYSSSHNNNQQYYYGNGRQQPQASFSSSTTFAKYKSRSRSRSGSAKRRGGGKNQYAAARIESYASSSTAPPPSSGYRQQHYNNHHTSKGSYSNDNNYLDEGGDYGRKVYEAKNYYDHHNDGSSKQHGDYPTTSTPSDDNGGRYSKHDYGKEHRSGYKNEATEHHHYTDYNPLHHKQQYFSDGVKPPLPKYSAPASRELHHKHYKHHKKHYHHHHPRDHKHALSHKSLVNNKTVTNRGGGDKSLNSHSPSDNRDYDGADVASDAASRSRDYHARDYGGGGDDRRGGAA